MDKRTDEDSGARAAQSPREPDAHGRAAMLLVESLIHALVARSVISASEAADVVDVALDVAAEIAIDRGELPAKTQEARALLTAVGASLRLDVPDR